MSLIILLIQPNPTDTIKRWHKKKKITNQKHHKIPILHKYQEKYIFLESWWFIVNINIAFWNDFDFLGPPAEAGKICTSLVAVMLNSDSRIIIGGFTQFFAGFRTGIKKPNWVTSDTLHTESRLLSLYSALGFVYLG